MAQLGWLSKKLCYVKKPTPKGYMLYHGIYITFWKKIMEVHNRLAASRGHGWGEERTVCLEGKHKELVRKIE